jgi:ATP-binding cassette subfamily F protein 3
MGFSGQMADTLVAKLSGGEKARLTLGLATFHAPHLVILDEPTNHLDIDSRAALIEAINDYPGAVMLVSHDRHLLEACADRLWWVEDGTIEPFDGDLDDYRRRVLSDRGRNGPGPKRKGTNGAAQPRPAPVRLSGSELAALRKRIAAAESVTAKLNAAIGKIDAQLGSADLFSSNPAKAAEYARTRADFAAKLAEAEEEWLAASTAYERAAS